mgnify:CR=1 FL=1
MSVSKDYLSGLLNSALIVAGITALVSVYGMTYQLGYYDYFGINPVVAGIEIDILTLANGGFYPAISLITIVGLVGLVVLYQKWLETNPIRTRLVRNIIGYILFFALMVIAIFASSKEPLSERIPIFLSTTVIVAQLFYSTVVKYKHAKALDDHEKLYKLFLASLAGYEPDEPKKAKNKKTYPLSIIGPIACVLFISVSLTLVKELAFTNASVQQDFTVLNADNERIQTVVIARSKDGLIVKEYDTKIGFFFNDYRIIQNANDLRFSVQELPNFK